MTTVQDTPTDTIRDRYLAGLIELAQWLGEHPEVPLPALGLHPDFRTGNHAPTITAYVYEGYEETENDPRAILAASARAMGRARKSTSRDGERFYVWREFGGIAFAVSAMREAVCERVVIGVETVTEVGPDPAAVAALPQIEKTSEREIVEWRCSSLLDETARP